LTTTTKATITFWIVISTVIIFDIINYNRNALLKIERLEPITIFEPIEINDFLQDENFSIGDIVQLNNGNVKIDYDPHTDFQTLREIRGIFSTHKIYNAEDAVKSLSSVRRIMNIEHLSFVCTKEDIRADKKIFELQQLYNNVLVYGGGFSVAAKTTGEPLSVQGYYKTGIKLETTPKLTATDAKNIVKKKDRKNISEIMLVILTVRDGGVHIICWRYHLSWFVNVSGEKYIFIDANTGEILE